MYQIHVNSSNIANVNKYIKSDTKYFELKMGKKLENDEVSHLEYLITIFQAKQVCIYLFYCSLSL